MQRHSRKLQRLSSVLAPVITASVLTASPSQAATLSFSTSSISEAELTIGELLNFSIAESLNEGEIDAISKNVGSFVDIINRFTNEITNIPPAPATIKTSAISDAVGKGNDYLGLGNTNAKIIGHIDVAKNELFSFNFKAFLDLETQIEDPLKESAQAMGELGFWLFDTTALNEKDLDSFANNLLADSRTNLAEGALEYFTLSSDIKTLGSGDSLKSNSSENISFTFQDQVVDFEEKDDLKEFSTASFEGSLQRKFDKDAKLTLFVTRKTQVRVAVPEPSTNLAFLISCGLAAIATNYKRRRTRFSYRNHM